MLKIGERLIRLWYSHVMENKNIKIIYKNCQEKWKNAYSIEQHKKIWIKNSKDNILAM